MFTSPDLVLRREGIAQPAQDMGSERLAGRPVPTVAPREGSSGPGHTTLSGERTERRGQARRGRELTSQQVVRDDQHAELTAEPDLDGSQGDVDGRACVVQSRTIDPLMDVHPTECPERTLWVAPHEVHRAPVDVVVRQSQQCDG